MIDLSINLGNLLTIAAFLLGGIGFAYSVKKDVKVSEIRLAMIDAQIEDFKQDIRKLNEIVIALAKQDGRIDRIEDRQLQEGKRIDEIVIRMDRLSNRSPDDGSRRHHA